LSYSEGIDGKTQHSQERARLRLKSRGKFVEDFQILGEKLKHRKSIRVERRKERKNGHQTISTKVGKKLDIRTGESSLFRALLREGEAPNLNPQKKSKKEQRESPKGTRKKKNPLRGN